MGTETIKSVNRNLQTIQEAIVGIRLDRLLSHNLYTKLYK